MLCREKLVFYALILALTLKSFELDPTLMAADLRLTTTRLVVYLREIGKQIPIEAHVIFVSLSTRYVHAHGI
eukprot:SAG31_NODE_11121_length_1064_cov_0.841451_2_plen_72_part_00